MRTCVYAAMLLGALLAAATAVAQDDTPYYELFPESYDPAVDVDTDLFVSTWRAHRPRREFGTLIVQDIFTPVTTADPFAPETRGAVLTDFGAVTHAMLETGEATERATLRGEQRIIYVYEGAGVLRAGGEGYDLGPGVAALIPEGLAFTLDNTGGATLKMYMIAEPVPAGFTPRRTPLIRDERDVPVTYTTGHWAHITKLLFGQPEGDRLASMNRIGIVWLDARTVAQAHSHGATFADEIWISLSDNAHVHLGKKLYELPAGNAYSVPANGRTPHANINVSDRPVKLIWFNMRREGTDETIAHSRLDPEPFNPEKDVDPDMVMSRWEESISRPLFGGLVVRDVFTRKQSPGLQPTVRGRVLNTLNYVSHARMLPLSRSTPSVLEDEQIVFYVTSGNGYIRAGGKTAALHTGIGVLMPPDVEFEIRNDSDEPLDMYLFSEPVPDDFTPRDDMLVRDESVAFKSPGGHWGNIGISLFTPEDGLATIIGMTPVWREPMSIAQPHASRPTGVDVVWLGLEGRIEMLLGKELRALPPGTGFVNPSDSRFYHSSINVTDRRIKLFWCRTRPE